MEEILVIAVLLGLIPGAIAHSKGRSFLCFWIYGFLLLIVALPHALLMKATPKALEDDALSSGGKKCPHCAEVIKAEANVCRFCGRNVVNEYPNVNEVTVNTQAYSNSHAAKKTPALRKIFILPLFLIIVLFVYMIISTILLQKNTSEDVVTNIHDTDTKPTGNSNSKGQETSLQPIPAPAADFQEKLLGIRYTMSIENGKVYCNVDKVWDSTSNNKRKQFMEQIVLKRYFGESDFIVKNTKGIEVQSDQVKPRGQEKGLNTLALPLPNSAFADGERLYESKQFERAIDKFNEALKVAPNNAAAIALRGKTNFQIGKMEAAVKDFSYLINKNSLDVEHIFRRGLAYFEMQEYEKAITDLGRACSLEGPGGSLDACNRRDKVKQKMQKI